MKIRNTPGGALLAALALCFPTAAMAGDNGPAPDDDPSGAPPSFEDSGISDSETSFEGAVMLEGDLDVTIGEIVGGALGDAGDARYAFFVGNTLYAGVEDAYGNTTDIIGEFFWFESSIDRGSDFYVGVFKVRTTPYQADGWGLEVEDEALLYLTADTDLTTGVGSFRWDWSVPFDSYGWDAFGSVTMETNYGIGLNAEGSILAATEYDIVKGVTASANIQARGFVDTSYNVNTTYQVTLWRWEVLVAANAGTMDWSLYLNSPDRTDQNAYHEFFLVMQTDEDVPFVIETLDFGGSARKYNSFWFDDHSTFSGALEGVTLSRPAAWEAAWKASMKPTATPVPGKDTPEEEPPAVEPDPTPEIVVGNDKSGACAVASPARDASPAGLLVALFALGLAVTLRRRR